MTDIELINEAVKIGNEKTRLEGLVYANGKNPNRRMFTTRCLDRIGTSNAKTLIEWNSSKEAI